MFVCSLYLVVYCLFDTLLLTALNYQDIITTFAGNGNFGCDGDSGQSVDAALSGPVSVASDTSGNLYIADNECNVVRLVTRSTGIITTYAGSGISGYSGDGFAATAAYLSSPSGVTVDSNFNLFIVDSVNRVIRMVDRAGIITTYAGNGYPSFSGDGGPATSASLNYPAGVALDSNGNLYIADQYNHVVRRVTRSTGIITTYAGSAGYCGYSGDGLAATSAYLYYPTSISVDSNFNVYIVDTAYSVIRMVSNSTGIITTYAGNGGSSFSGDGGPATLASFTYIGGIALDSNGNLYIADEYNQVIRMVTYTGIVVTFAGNGFKNRNTNSGGYRGDGGLSTLAELDVPSGVSVDLSGNVYIADYGNSVVRLVATTALTTSIPSMQPTMQPSSQPSTQPSRQPISLPTTQPSSQPSRQPFIRPTTQVHHMTCIVISLYTSVFICYCSFIITNSHHHAANSMSDKPTNKETFTSSYVPAHHKTNAQANTRADTPSHTCSNSYTNLCPFVQGLISSRLICVVHILSNSLSTFNTPLIHFPL